MRPAYFASILALSVFISGVRADPPFAPTSTRSGFVTSEHFAPALQRAALEATVVVHDVKGNSLGSGVVVARDASGGFVITAFHCIDGGGEIYVEILKLTKEGFFGYSREVRQVRIVAQSPKSDLAILYVPGDSLPEPIPVSPPELAIATPFPVLTVGCNGGTQSIIATYATDTASMPRLDGTGLRTLAKCFHGRSGGPMINREGRLVGICVRLDANERGIYQGLDEITRILDQARMSHVYEIPIHRERLSERLIYGGFRQLLFFLVATFFLKRQQGFVLRKNLSLPWVLFVQATLVVVLALCLWPVLPTGAKLAIMGITAAFQYLVSLFVGRAYLFRPYEPLAVLPSLGTVAALAFNPSAIEMCMVAVGAYSYLIAFCIAGKEAWK